jgi:hypothetical protein
MAGHCSLGNSCRYAHGVEDDHNVPNEDESPKRKRNKKKKEKKEAQPHLPLDPMAAVNPQFFRGFDAFKGQEEILQQIVSLCSQLEREDLAAPHLGLNPFLPSALSLDGSPTAKPGKGYPGAGSFTPSTVASTNASPHFMPLDLAPDGGAEADNILFGMQPLLFNDKVSPQGSMNGGPPINLPTSLFANGAPFI